ncbi:MAG TPA: hypothetical protein VMW27_19110 [Thermoanaerobaculia bacterium]|nr:hypothetical protein [Thermoanaerobaculia bacterium]
MEYTRDAIMSQVYVAFGQVCGAVRVSQGACVALHERYLPRIDDRLPARWDTEAAQVLERLRAIGRTAAAHAAIAGENVISPARLTDAARRVEVQSGTLLCPDDPNAVSHREDLATEPYTRDGIMAQVLVAFGQGTGPVRASSEACQLFYDRYEPLIDRALLAAWKTEGVQVLERIRSIGRSALLQSNLEGVAEISRGAVLNAMKAVEASSRTSWCPPGDEAQAGVGEGVGVVAV